jgi:hypothetical protein
MPPGVVVELLAFDVLGMRWQGRSFGDETGVEFGVSFETAEDDVAGHDWSVASRASVVRRIGDA